MRATQSKKPDKRRYRTTNWREYNKALKAGGSLTVWLYKDMQWFALPTGKQDRRLTFSGAAIQFCLCIKCLLGLALRQALGFAQSLLPLAGLQWPVPDCSTLSRRQQTLKTQQPYRPNTTALDLLVDVATKVLADNMASLLNRSVGLRAQGRRSGCQPQSQPVEGVQSVVSLYTGVAAELSGPGFTYP